MVKAYTDIEQSRKLIEFLPLDSADMEYILEHWIDEKTGRHKEEYCEIPVVKVDDDCPLQPITHPCWSLAALLPFLSGCVFHTPNPLGESYCCKHITSGFEVHSDNLIDACYQMLSKLHEQKLL